MEDTKAAIPDLDFSSTLGTGSLSLISSWAKECASSHTKCHKIFGTNGLSQPGTWFPDRLIQVTLSESPSSTSTDLKVTARIVQKSNPADFPSKSTTGITYISLSHSWGPAPNPSAPLQGRADTVLTASNLPRWQTDLPLDSLPLTFQDAIRICASLGFAYIWIDSLCILQDSREDWVAQSAVMGDVYKFAWLNIAALSTTSDYEGFINTRDPRVEFGFRAPFSGILKPHLREKNPDAQECVLARGKAKLLWNFARDIPGSNSFNAPLFTRAWVYQERSLARRTLAFAKNAVYWACDEYSRGEQPGWAIGGLEQEGLRGTLHGVLETASKLAAHTADGSIPRQAPLTREDRLKLIQGFDLRWFLCVTSYTLCKLTKQTDKLIAVSSVARELANMKVVGKRYLAGLWDINLPFQLAWISVQGDTTPARKRVGDAEYVAPSWSWASIEAPVQPRFIFDDGDRMKTLADVRAAEVKLETGYVFGSVRAGWLGVWGRLNHVVAAERKPYTGDKSKLVTSLTDGRTGEKLWFCSDTREGYEIVEKGKGVRDLVWMPLTLRFDARMVQCTALVLIQVQDDDGIESGEGFVKKGDKFYRRLGTGDFGRIPSMLRQDRLLLELGTYPDGEVKDGEGQELSRSFKRNEDGFEEFILI
jgi:hypothetical protein